MALVPPCQGVTQAPLTNQTRTNMDFVALCDLFLHKGILEDFSVNITLQDFYMAN